ncbi:MAG: ParB/RepB/Spo0J family partition protein [Candidatus Paceibacterota bacterium]|jgi:ParB family chromosome partitioning protein
MLGKGLESLIPRREEPSQDPAKKESIFWVEIGQVVPNPYQPRKEFEQAALEILADSIKRYGILQPIIVTKNEKHGPQGMVPEYQIIAGERRLRASKMIGLDQVPVVIKEQTEKEKLEISLIENVHRENLNAIEKAETFERFQKEFGLLQKEIAKLVGMSREAVANAMRLNGLPEVIKQGVKEGKISEGHARAILMVKTEAGQKKLFEEMVRGGYSVRQAEKRAQEMEGTATDKPKRSAFKKPSAVILEIEDRIKKTLNIESFKVKEDKENSKLKLTIVFKTKKEIDDWLDDLKK